ncbi:MAG TPA: S8 family serine peptidase [Paludibaculum sp.]|jgi:hypothetical protein
MSLVHACTRRAAWTIVIAGLIPAAVFAQDISDTARQQIADIIGVKKTFNAAESKLSSNLAFAARLQRGDLPASVASLVQNIADANGRVDVEIQGPISSTLASQVVGLGGTVTDVQPRNLSATVPLSMVGTIAGDSSVISIREKESKSTNRYTSIPGTRSVVEFDTPKPSPANSREESLGGPRRRASRDAQIFPLLASLARPAGLSFFLGSLTSQGYISHQAQQVVSTLGINGTGVKVGVLSDSATPARVAALIATGDLPANTVVLPGQAGPAGGSDEGTAMMEIVADMAPGAQLYFATAFTSSASFAANILALRAAGCDIIVDDVTYFNEGVFQDGPIAKAVNQVVADGALYFSSASNSGNITKGTSGTWEGDFLDGGAVSGPPATAGETGNFHNFGTAGSPQNWDVLTAGSTFLSVKWSDPLGASTNDYDFFVLNSTGTTLTAFSAAVQNGTQDPYEAVSRSAGFAANSRLVIVKFSGADRALHLDTERGRVSIRTTGATFGHNAAEKTITAAATYWNSARTGTRPFTGAANTIETFSSDGPRKMFYTATGVAITPGNVLFGTNGGTTLQKPDLTAADGVTTRTPGFNPFFGTSASAPHLAGIAALIKSAKPGLTNTQIRQIMINTSLDNMAPGWDRDGGYGIAMALAAVKAALLLP